MLNLGRKIPSFCKKKIIFIFFKSCFERVSISNKMSKYCTKVSELDLCDLQFETKTFEAKTFRFEKLNKLKCDELDNFSFPT